MLNLLSALESYDPKHDYVLAIVTSTQGSTYRKAGTLMLLDSHLNYFGLISGGCLEGDIQEHTKEVLTKKIDKLINYDMRGDEDLIWGMGLGCDGAIDVLLKYLPAESNHLDFFDALTSINQGKHRKLTINMRADYQLVLEPGRLDNVLSSESTLTIPLIPPVNILICGASPDVPPVAALAKQLGWKSTVIDHRPDFVKPEHFPLANNVQLVKRSQWSNFDLSRFDAVIIMTHQFERDQDYLNRLLTSEIEYIGLLGPTARRDKLLKNLDTNFERHEGRVFGPVGLDIGADSPETIALAIIAEIQAVRAKKSVGFCYQDKTR